MKYLSDDSFETFRALPIKQKDDSIQALLDDTLKVRQFALEFLSHSLNI